MNTLVTGLQPTGNGELHLGNYLGVVKELPKIINGNNAFVFAADIHATTLLYNPKELRNSSLNLLKALYVSGVPEHSLFIQSHVPQHFEMGIIIQHLTTIGQLENMTQYKNKSKQNEQREQDNQESIPTGILTYPALMAGDVLLYKANIVPAGDDQTQHIQYIRDIIDAFKKRYKSNFLIKPDITKFKATRIMQLNEPTQKMSKSSNNQNGTIYITETMDIVRKKYKKAVSGSAKEVYPEFYKNELGVQNLLNILSGFHNVDKEIIAQTMAGKNMAQLKEEITNTHDYYLSPIRNKMESLTHHDMNDILLRNLPHIKEIAHKNMGIIRKIIGFD